MLARKTELIDVEAIQLGDRLRHINPEAVASLQASMEKIGLRTPITVRMMDPEAISDPLLVSGHHRLEAAKALGWQQIECFVVDHESDDEARMWEIAENLHRCELNTLERSEQISEWVRLCEVFHAKQGIGVREAARELNIAPVTVHRAQKIDALTPEAKQAAREAGIDGSQRRLMEVAKADPDKQVEAVRAVAARPALKPAPDPLEDVGALEKQVAGLMNAWNNAGPDAREEFLMRIGR